MTMLHTIVLHFILLTSFVHLQESTVREADEAYRQGDYATAIEHYEAVLDKQCASAKLYYNLGNAYYRTDQMGLAILNYRRALRLDPSMTDARENLALAESRTVDRIDALPQFFLVRWVDTLCTRITPTVWRIIWLVLLALTGAAVVLVRLGASRSLRKGALAGGLVVVALLLLTTWLMLRSTHRFNAHAEAVVMPPAITVKGSPEAQSLDKLILHEGTLVTISDSLSSWYKITIADGTTGWCRAEDVERI